jgi:hypothetical protein
MSAQILQEILVLLTTDPPRAADRMDELAERIRESAARVRAAARAAETTPTAFASPGGAVDRAFLDVIGPDGRLKQRGAPNGEDHA